MDHFPIKYGKPFYIVCIKNQPINIGTNQELELYKPYRTILFFGAKINTFGLRLFQYKKDAIKFCKENKS